MPDILDENGLQIETLPEIIANLENGFKAIYGNDINLDQNSPDGQIINIFAQAGRDNRERLLAIYNSYNPDKAVGKQLDERLVINNIERNGGSYTIQPIDITFDRTVSLQGLDDDFDNLNGTGFTVQDDAGNQFILIDSETFTAGSYSRNFRAKSIGRVETIVDTINTPVTIVLGVTDVTNSAGALEIGQDEETDAQARTRRQQSVSLAASGYLNGLLGTVLNLDGVSDAALHENVTNITDADGIPAHGTWLIVEGGSNTDIANAIYAKKSYGSNMKGAVMVDITTASGTIFTAKFDRPTAANLWIRFDIQKYTASATFDQPAIKQHIVDNSDYSIGQFAETASITCIIKDYLISVGNLGTVVNLEISNNGSTWVDYLPTATKDKQWVTDVSRVAITIL